MAACVCWCCAGPHTLLMTPNARLSGAGFERWGARNIAGDLNRLNSCLALPAPLAHAEASTAAASATASSNNISPRKQRSTAHAAYISYEHACCIHLRRHRSQCGRRRPAQLPLSLFVTAVCEEECSTNPGRELLRH
jgi:hypothetical protein